MGRAQGAIPEIPLAWVAVPAIAVDMPGAAPPVDSIRGRLAVLFPIH
jgi:hypothetical protein